MRASLLVALILTLGTAGFIALPRPVRQVASCPCYPGPKDLDEVAAVARELGLYYRSDRRNGEVTGRLVLSEMPLKFEQAAFLRISDPEHPSWIGRVAVQQGWRDFEPINFSPGRSAIWGEMFVLGDPRLVELIVQRRAGP